MPKLFDGVLILSDLDNTFLGTHSRIVPENLEAIEYFKSEGGLFSFATGRDPYALRIVVPQADKIANFASVVANGAYLYDFQTDKYYSETPLDKSRFLPLLKKVLDAFPTVGMRISTKECFLCPNTTDVMLNSLQAYQAVTRLVPFENLPADTPFYKCVFHSEPELLTKVRAFINENGGEDFALSASSVSLFEILDKEATKGKKVSALRKLTEKPVTIYGAGDWENDLELLRASDIACSPENAMDCVKELSQIHLCHHDKGAIKDLIEIIERSRRKTQ